MKNHGKTQESKRNRRIGRAKCAAGPVSVFILALLGALAVWPASAVAAVAAGRIAGVVRDPSGGVIPGGEIRIKNPASGLSRSTVTNPQGHYLLDTLPAGSYSVSAVVSGFAASEHGNVVVKEGGETILDFVLMLSKNVTAIQVDDRVPAADLETIVPARARTSDTASLLSDIPGLDLYNSGGLASLPVVHGMADDRVNVLINGMLLASACSNHMNPPLSYIDPANVAAISVMAGITPVSRGGDSIAGTIAVESAAPIFAKPNEGVQTHGGLAEYHRTNGVVNGGSAWVSVASKTFRAGYTASYVHASDYKDGAGVMVKSTLYESQNHSAQFAVRHGIHVIALDLGYQRIPRQAFVNARMDMTGNEAKFANIRYDGAFGAVRLEARASYENTRHEMNILADKIPGMNMPMNTRGTNSGYSVGIEIPVSAANTLRTGTEYHRFTLDDWWTPVTATVGSMGPGTLLNVNKGRRDRFGTYLEWETRRGRWTGMLGIRGDVVRMNTGDIAGYNASTTTTGSAAYDADARAFNSRDRRRLDANLDLTASARYEPGSTFYEFGYARKTRSPNLYERYLWVKRSAMSAQMNGWFGDGNGYTGDPDLRPEVANTVSASAGWHGRKGWELKLTPYYTHVQDYIDVDRCPVIADGSSGCTAAKFSATSGFVSLQYANHAARLYGVDGSFRIPLAESPRMGALALSGAVGYLRGEDLDTGGNLYHIMPLHGHLALEHHRGSWSSTLDFQAVDSKTDVQAVRIELPTAGYALANLRTAYQWHLGERVSLRLDAGIDNLSGRRYDLPLGGRYWIGDKAGKSSVPGEGRSFYTGLTFQF